MIAVIQFASRALTPTEQRYSQTEREAFAITWARFSTLTSTSSAVNSLSTLTTSPWSVVQQSSRSTLCPNWTLDDENAALHNDCSLPSWLGQPSWLLQSTSSTTVSQQQRRENRRWISSSHCQHVNLHVHDAGHGHWKNCERPYSNCSDQRHSLQRLASERQRWHKNLQSTLLVSVRTVTHSQCKHTNRFKGRQIVLPNALRLQAVKIAHSGHQGSAKTLALLREEVWFGGMQETVEKTVKDCFTCQISTPTPAREPLQMSPLPTAPWSQLSADFADAPNGHTLLMVTDKYYTEISLQQKCYSTFRPDLCGTWHSWWAENR